MLSFLSKPTLPRDGVQVRVPLEPWTLSLDPVSLGPHLSSHEAPSIPWQPWGPGGQTACSELDLWPW